MHSTKSNIMNMNKPKLLLHICCAPCSSYVIEHLCEKFDIIAYFYNPNIYPKSEYEHRRNEIQEFYSKFLPAKNVKLVIEDADPSVYFDEIDFKNHPEYADEPEQGERCYKCYQFRMKKAFEYAERNRIPYFTTTLSISPYKNSHFIYNIGMNLQDSNVTFYSECFSDGFDRSREISEEFNLYRQQYCGCTFSKRTAVPD